MVVTLNDLHGWQVQTKFMCEIVQNKQEFLRRHIIGCHAQEACSLDLDHARSYFSTVTL